MKRIFLLAALGASTFASCKDGTGKDGTGGTRPVPSASSPDFDRELARRRTAWMEQRPIQDENKMTPERVRRMEMGRLELASLSQEAAATALGLGEGERSGLRKALTEFRDATLFRIEHPDAGSEARGPNVEPYQNRQRKLLGDARYSEFARLEQQEREKLIAGRRAFRRSSASPSGPAAPQPSE
jgi:hypothetical protein